MGRLLLDPSASSYSSFIIYYPNARMDKSFFKIWVLCIPHHFEGTSLDGEGLIFNCSHLLFSYYESRFFFFPESAESNHFLLAHIPCMNESHDPGKPFKLAITNSTFSTSSSIATSYSLIWETLVKYDCMVSAFGSSHSLTIFSKSYSNLCSPLQITWSKNQTYSVSLRKTLVVQGYP